MLVFSTSRNASAGTPMAPKGWSLTANVPDHVLETTQRYVVMDGGTQSTRRVM